MNDNSFLPRQDTLDQAIAAFQGMSVPERPSDESVLAGLPDQRAEIIRPWLRFSQSLRRSVMRPTFRYAAAAALVLGVVCWFFLSSAPSLALADVIKATEQHTLVRYTMRQITEDKVNGRGETVSTVYADLKSARFRIESRIQYPDGEALLINVQDPPNNRSLMTNSREKTANVITGLWDEGKKVKPFLDNLREFQDKKSVVSEKDKLDGRAAVKYTLVEDGKTTTLWVDAQTKLPLQLEDEFVDPTLNISLNKFVFTAFEWDPTVNNAEELFSTKPPDGYTVTEEERAKQPK
jgi:hypothetical protein